MIAIIDYGAGNIRSVQNALTRMGCESVLTADPKELLAADKVILPGVGEASFAMQRLREKNLETLIPQLTRPVLGICLGLQLMCSHTEEGNTACLNIFSAKVRKFPPKANVPHIGWNTLSEVRSKLLNPALIEDDFYFVHSYFAEISSETSATCDYILPFSAVLERDNFFATQFHPEKSSNVGQKLLTQFLNL